MYVCVSVYVCKHVSVRVEVCVSVGVCVCECVSVHACALGQATKCNSLLLLPFLSLLHNSPHFGWAGVWRWLPLSLHSYISLLALVPLLGCYNLGRRMWTPSYNMTHAAVSQSCSGPCLLAASGWGSRRRRVGGVERGQNAEVGASGNPRAGDSWDSFPQKPGVSHPQPDSRWARDPQGCGGPQGMAVCFRPESRPVSLLCPRPLCWPPESLFLSVGCGVWGVGIVSSVSPQPDPPTLAIPLLTPDTPFLPWDPLGRGLGPHPSFL